MNTSKTLLQILVEELPKRGGFPIRSTKSVQDADGEIKFHADGYSLVFEKNKPGIWGSDTANAWPDYTQQFTPDSLSSDYATAIITREQYEAALAFVRTYAGLTIENLRFEGAELTCNIMEKRPAERITFNHTFIAADGWIDWAGGERPVDNGVLVEVKYKNEKNYHIKGVNHAGRWSWAHYGTDGDIIAYRLHQPKELEEHAHVGGVTGPVTEALDEADLNECMGQSPEDLDRLEILLLKEISYYAPEIGLGAATKIASGIVSAGYRKH